MKATKEFRDFIMRGNVLDLAIGIVIGVAFAAIVSSLVNDIIMPPIGYLLRGIDLPNLFFVLREGSTPVPYLTLVEAKDAGAVTINYGAFINTIISFLIIAAALFVIIKNVTRFKKAETPPAPETKQCPFCLETVPLKAIRCRFCTSNLNNSTATNPIQ